MAIDLNMPSQNMQCSHHKSLETLVGLLKL